jgi:hypothetical protein
MSEQPDRNPADREFGGEQAAGQPNTPGRPPRVNRALWIAGAAVLVVALVVAVVVSLSGDDDSDPDNDRDTDPNGPTDVANAVVDALNAQDETAIRPLMCEPRVPNVLVNIEAKSVVRHHAWVEGPATVAGDSATVPVVINASDERSDTNLSFDLYLTRRGNGWCADQFSGPASYTRI